MTQDEHDKKTPFKKFPADKPYVRLAGSVYLNRPLACFVKSRQIVATWLFSGLDLWDAMFHDGRLLLITNKREEDAAKLVYANKTGRIWVIFSRLPPWMQARAKARWGFAEVSFANGSKIWGLPDGSEQARSHTASRVRIEEARSQDRLEETLQAVQPTTVGGGQVIFVSSAGAGYFERIVHDKMDDGAPPPARRYRDPMQGVSIWENGRNRYYCVQIHYTADPVKRDPRWIEEARRGMSEAQWREEQEIDWSSKAGTPAIPIFAQRQHQIVIPPFEIPAWWPRFAAADYGSTNPYCCLFGAVSPDGAIYIYWCYYAPGPLGLHAAAIRAHPDFEKLEIYILDRSCWANNQQVSVKTIAGQTLHSMQSIADLHEQNGITPSPAHVVQDRVKVAAIYEEWGDLMPTPRCFIFQTCADLIRELPLQRWAPSRPDQNESEKLVDKDNHSFDALCYALLYRRQGLASDPSSIRMPSAEEIEKARMLAIVSEFDRQQDQKDSERGSGKFDPWGLDS